MDGNKPKEKKMEMTKESALELLAAMCADGAECIETGARQYLEGVKLERKGKKMLKNALMVIEQGREMKDSGLYLIKPEVKFFKGEEFIHPMVDGEYVMSRIVRGVVEAYDNEDAILEWISKVTKPEETDDKQ